MSNIKNSPVRTKEQIYLEQILSEIKNVSFISHNRKNENAVFRHNLTGEYFYLRIDPKYIYFIPDSPTGNYVDITTEISSQLGIPGKSFETRFWKRPTHLESIVVSEPTDHNESTTKHADESAVRNTELPKKEKFELQKTSRLKTGKKKPHKLVDATSHELTRKIFGNVVPEQFQIIGYQEKRAGLYVRLVSGGDQESNTFWITQTKSNVQLSPDLHAERVPALAIKLLENLTGRVATPLRKTSSKLELLERIVTDSSSKDHNVQVPEATTMRYLPRNLIDATNHPLTKAVFSESVPEQFSIFGYQSLRNGIFLNYGQIDQNKKNAFWIISKGKSKFKLVPSHVNGEIPKAAILQLERITGKVAYPVKRSEYKFVLMEKKIERMPGDQRVFDPTKLSPYEQTQAYQKMFSGKAISSKIKIVGYDSKTDGIFVTIESTHPQNKADRIWLSTTYNGSEIRARPFGYTAQISQSALLVLEEQFGMKPQLMPRSQRKYRLVSNEDLLAEEKRRTERAAALHNRKPLTKKEPKELTRSLPNANLINTSVATRRLPGFLYDAFNGYAGLSVFAYDDARKGLILRHEDKKSDTYTFGIGLAGKCVFLRRDSGGLDSEPSQRDMAEIGTRLNATRYEYSKLERAAIWYVDNLIQNFPEIKF